MPIETINVSALPLLNGEDLVATDYAIILDKSATTGPGSGPKGTLKKMESGRFASFTTTKGVVRNLSLVGVDTTQELFTWVAQAINANGPYTGNAGEDLYFRTYQVSGPQNNYSVTIMYFKLLSGRLTAGGPSNTIAPSELVLSGGPWVINGETNADLFLAIGDAGSGPIHSYFNLGEDQDPGGDPWTIAGQIFLTGTLDGQPTIWQFLAGDGDWGGDSGNFTTADDFINLSLQPAAAGFELTKIHQLSLGGIDLNQPELNYIAAAVLAKGPFTCLPGQQMVFRTQTTIGTQTNYSVVRRYYRLVKNYTSVGGVGALFPLPSWFMPDGDAYVQPVEGQGIIVELGDIGTDDVWDAFNDGDEFGEAWDMSVYRFVRATQDAEIRFWAFEGLQRYYGGDDAGTDPDIYLATEDDFFLLTDEPTAPAPVNKLFYEDIAAMIANQAEQTTQTTLCVADASDDGNITFADGETRLQAFYRWLGTTDEDIDDYELVSAPYGNHTDGGDAIIEFQPEITDTTTVFDGTQKGAGKIYTFNSAAAQTVQIDNGDYIENDVINIERRGLGSVEILEGTDVRFQGVRDVEGRYFIADPNSIVSLICRGNYDGFDWFSIIGNLKHGYTLISTYSYSLLREGETGVDVYVNGVGFTAIMDTPIVSANATLNSWTFIDKNNIILNLDAVGDSGDFVTLTYYNGNYFVDTNAIEIALPVNVTETEMNLYLKFEDNFTDSTTKGNNGTGTGMTFNPSGKVGKSAVFVGSPNSQVLIADANSLSFGNGTTDSPFSIAFGARFSNTSGTQFILIKGGAAASNKEYQIVLASGVLSLTLFDASTTGTKIQQHTLSPSSGIWYHIMMVYDGTQPKIFVNNVEVGSANNSGTYVAMENLSENLLLGQQIAGGTGNSFKGELDEFMIANVAIDSDQRTFIYENFINGTPIL